MGASTLKEEHTYINCKDIEAFRKIQLKLLDVVDEICKKHNLKYWLDFGALLGAARTGTFIPWDDDLDVSMPMADYKKFLSVASQELPDDIFLQTPKTDPTFREYFTKLRDKNSTMIEKHESPETRYHQGIFIDIVPSIEYPFIPKLLKKVLMYSTVRTRYAAYVRYHYRWFNFIAYWSLKLIWKFIFLLPKKYYGQTPEDNGYMYTIPKEYLYPLGKIMFEGKKYPAPQKVHEHLETMYKNHMTPLPPEKRVSHSKFIDPHTPCIHKNAQYT